MRQSRSRAARRGVDRRQEGGVSRPVLTPETENVVDAPGLQPDGNGAVGPGVNGQFGGISPSIRTLTAIPPSQARPTQVAAPNAVESPSTLQTIVTSAALTRTLPNTAPNAPTAVLEVAPEAETSLADIIIPVETAEGELALPTGAEYNMEEEVAGVAGAEGGEGGVLPELGEKESEVILPENNRGVAVGIAFGAFALLALFVVAGMLFMRWKKGKRESIFDRPPPPGITRSTMAEKPSNTYVNDKMPSQTQYASYANLEDGSGGGGVRKSLGKWIQNTQSRFSTPTTDGGIVSMYARQNDPLPPPPPSFLRPGAGGGDGR